VSHGVVDALIIGGLVAGLGLLAWRIGAVRAELSREIERLERLNDTGRVLLTDRNVRGVMHHVVDSAARMLGCDGAWVVLGGVGDTYLTLESATGPLAPSAGSALRAYGTMAGWVVARAEPLVLNAPEDGRPFASLHQRVELKRAAVLPLLAKGRCIGALGVENPHGGRSFTAPDVDLLRELADYAALSVESLQAVEELSERERRAALINSVNSRIRQSLDLQVILDTAVRELGTALKVSRCYVRLRRAGELMPIAAEWAAPDVPLLGARADPAAPITQAALRDRRTWAVTDARDEPSQRGTGAAAEQALGVLATPIVLRGEAIGVLAFHQAGLPRHWRPGDIGLVEEVAAELAIGIANARLYRSVEEASRELATKIAELERANRLTAQFLANMSHELRTPLNSVIGFSELLLAGVHGSLGAEQRDALLTIARNGRHLLGLVNDVLDLSKVEAGRMELVLAATDLARLVPDVLAGMESLIRAKDHTVTVGLGPGPLVVRADEMRVRQILFNLLSNAVKFTAPGGAITVRGGARRAPRPAGRGDAERDAVWVAVSDTGIGIAPEDQQRLFTEFTQVDASFARRHEGTGLGLALCKRLMEMHGGRIGLESAPGAGSTFWVEFPVEGPPRAAA